MMSSESCHHKPIPVLGYTTRRHLLLDLDNCTQYKATRLSQLIMKQWHKVGDCLVAISSVGHHKEGLIYTKLGRPLRVTMRDNYHLVFDNGIGYNLSCKIIHTLANLHVLERGYVKIRSFRGDMTLRVSPAILTHKTKPIPRPVAYIINRYTKRRDGYILHYLNMINIAHQMYSLFHPAAGDFTEPPQAGNGGRHHNVIMPLT